MFGIQATSGRFWSSWKKAARFTTRAICGTALWPRSRTFLALRAATLFACIFALFFLAFLLCGRRRRGDFFTLGARRLFHVSRDKKNKVQVKNYDRRAYYDDWIFQHAENDRQHDPYFHASIIGKLPRLLNKLRNIVIINRLSRGDGRLLAANLFF